MNECNAFARAVRGGFLAYVRTVRDAAAKPIPGPGGKPMLFPTELEATKKALGHLIRYINGNLVRDGDIAQAATDAADAVFAPELRRKRSRRGRRLKRPAGGGDGGAL